MPLNSNLSPTINDIPQETRALIEEELGVLDATKASLDTELKQETLKWDRERHRSRELTSGLVATRRDEDRYLLASDEAVSHQLSSQHEDAVTTLESLRKKPYFGRVVLDEEDGSGRSKRLEYKIGYAANPTCRIVDWRRAPLSRLYYEYREGDDYCEEIQGRERAGRIELRNTVEIQEGSLQQITCRYGTFRSTPDGWIGTSRAYATGRDFSALPEVLSLITPDQFRTITKDSAEPILIQGVAGSGKTTVALHRLSWLLEQGNSDLIPKDALVITLGPSLREYIRKSLAALDAAEVSVYSYRLWCGKQITPFLPPSIRRDNSGELLLTPSHQRPPAGVERVKRSVGLLRAIEESAKHSRHSKDPLALLLDVLSRPDMIRQFDETGLLDASIIEEALQRTKDICSRGTLDRSDFSLLLRCLQMQIGAVESAGRTIPYGHILIDEVQDYSPIELATLLSTIGKMGDLTLVGDTNQQVEDGFPGWKKLQRWWDKKRLTSSLVRLDVSHRSTREIMACAGVISKSSLPSGNRSGKKPIWMFSREAEQSIGALIEWLKEISGEAPTALIGVICFSSATARETYTLLSPSLGPTVRLNDEASFSFEEGIVVTDVQSVRGLEFFGVAVIQPMTSTLPSGPSGRNLLYIATTRAQERLAFVSWGRSGCLLQECPERILGRVDLDEGEEEETATHMEELN